MNSDTKGSYGEGKRSASEEAAYSVKKRRLLNCRSQSGKELVGDGAVVQASCGASGFQWFFKPGCLQKKKDIRHQKSKECDASLLFLAGAHRVFRCVRTRVASSARTPPLSTNSGHRVCPRSRDLASSHLPSPSQPPRSRSVSTARPAGLSGLPAPRSPLRSTGHRRPRGVARGKLGMQQAPRACHTGRQGQKYKGAASPFARPQTPLAPDAGWRRDSANSNRGPQCRRCSAVCEPWVPVLLSSSTGPPPKPPNGFLKFLEQNPHSDQSSFP